MFYKFFVLQCELKYANDIKVYYLMRCYNSMKMSNALKIQWIFCVFCFISALAIGVSLFSFIILVVGIISLPIKPIKNILKTYRLNYLKLKHNGSNQ